MKRILVLYRELAGYFVDCLNYLCDHHNVEAVVVAYPVHADAPFQFAFSPGIEIRQRQEFDAAALRKLVEEGGFDLIFCGGWFDKEYLQAIAHRKCPALLGFDNQWRGNMKQIASVLYARFFIKPLFEHAFVPGSKQIAFARKLGFASSAIHDAAYSCNTARFASLHESRKQRIKGEINKLIYTGRYAPEKFVNELWDSFSELRSEGFTSWELHCAGTGPLWDQRPQRAGIFHHGFMQPDLLYTFMKDGDAFILPSTFEPWGVVVHEFAAAGYPLVLSDAVGASEAFLRNDENGFLFTHGSKKSLKDAMRKLFLTNSIDLRKMEEISVELAQKITPARWAATLYSLM